MKYKIWDKKTDIITPVGEVLTPDQWIERYPVAGLSSITVLCADSEINGAFFGTLGSTAEIYASQGADFTGADTDEEKLKVINAFEAQKETKAISLASVKAVSPLEEIASTLKEISAALTEIKDTIKGGQS